MKLKEKIRQSRGFTLAEMLITVLILLMVSTVVGAGVPAAVSAYDKVIDGANAQLLLSTTISRLEQELGTAVEVWTDDSDNLEFFSHYRNGYKIELINDEEAGDAEAEKEGIKLRYSARFEEGMSIPGSELSLVSKQMGTKKFYVQFGDITFKDGVFSVSDLSVMKNNGDPSPLKLEKPLFIRPVINPVLNPDSEP